MPDPPKLDYARTVKDRKRPWWLDVALVVVSAAGVLVGLLLLAWLLIAIFVTFPHY